MTGPRARWTDPKTSHSAAESVYAPAGITEAQCRILVLLARYGPQTDEQLAANYTRSITLLSWPPVSSSGLRTRRRELVDGGHVVASDRTGLTASKRTCSIWQLARPAEVAL